MKVNKNELVDEVSEMRNTHEAYISEEGWLEASILMMKVDIKKGGRAQCIMRFYVL